MFKVRSQNGPPVWASQANWEARSTGAGVVWAHDFETDAEVDNFLNMAQQAPYNSFCSFDDHDRILYAHRTAANAAALDRPMRPGETPIPYDPGLRGFGCLQLVGLGATLAQDVDTDPGMSSEVVSSATFTYLANLSGYFECPTLTSYIANSSYTNSDRLVFKVVTSLWTKYFACTLVTDLGGGMSRYNVKVAATQGPFPSGVFQNMTLDACYLGHSTDLPTSVFILDQANAPYFPDPGNNPAKYYCLSLQTGEYVDKNNTDVPRYTTYYPVYPGQTAGQKGVKEFVTVLSKTGNALTVRRGGVFGERNSFSNWGYPVKFLAGSPIGNDCDGGWSRWFSAVPAIYNGKSEDDLGRPLRIPTGLQIDKNQGYYGHSFYHTMYPTFDGHEAPWDGDDFYLQFRVKWSPNRRDLGMVGGKLWFIDSMNGLTSQQCIGDGMNGFDGTAYIGTFGAKGSENYDHPQGDNSYPAYLQPDVLHPQLSESPLMRTGSPTNGRRWPLDEWLTVNIHIKPGYVRDNRVPNINHQYDLHNELLVDTTYFPPTNNGLILTFETTVPRPFRFHPVPRSTTNYFRNWLTSWPTNILGTILPAFTLTGYSQRVETSYLVDHGGVQRLRWVLVERGAAYPMPPAGVVPLHGDRMYVSIGAGGLKDSFNDMPAGTPNLKCDTYEMEVIRADGTTRYQIYRKFDYCLEYGSEGVMKFNNDPPAWNRFQPTGYANINDNLTPFRSTVWHRFGQCILSKLPIPDPTD